MGNARITLSSLQYGQTFQNVFHINYGEAAFDATAIQAAIQTYWINQIKSMQLSSNVYKLIQVRDVSVVGGLTVNFAISITCSGGSAIETWGPCSALFSFHTGFAGRHGRGRIYIGAQYPGDVQAGQWSSAKNTQMIAMAAALSTRWLGATPTSGYNLVICPRTVPATAHFVTEIVPQPVPGVQRRRNYGVGI